MKNEDRWTATKFVQVGEGRWAAGKDRRFVNPGSRLLCNLAAAEYSKLIFAHGAGDILDLGCGNAPLYGMYSKVSRSVTCVDWPESVHGLAFVDRAMDLNGSFDLETASFDTIICSDVVEHIWNLRNFWSETARVLRPGGKLVLGTPFMYWLHEEPHDYFRYTPFALRAACEEAGLTVTSVEMRGGAIHVVGDIIGKITNAMSPTLGKISSSAITLAVGLKPFEILSRKSESKFGLMQFLVAVKPTE